MNGTPSSTRTRGFCRTTGLRLCKGRLDPRGTWPARLPAWASAPIDHVFASDGIRMVSRRVLGSGGSDHRALMVEIALPRGP
jgi:endonuclease/exonuclease/phosphatase (EEP) superfamily protein YafD